MTRSTSSPQSGNARDSIAFGLSAKPTNAILVSILLDAGSLMGDQVLTGWRSCGR
jgi:hypothetical protein